MLRIFKATYTKIVESKEKDEFINRIFQMRDKVLEIDNLIFKGVDFSEDPIVLNLTVSYFY